MALILAGFGCQSTFHRSPTQGASLHSQNEQLSSPPQSGLRAHPLIELLDTTSVLYSNGRLSDAKVVIAEHLTQSNQGNLGAEPTFRSQFLEALLLFYDDPGTGIGLLQQLRPTDYNEAAALAVFEAHVFSLTHDCDEAVDVLSTFIPVGRNDRKDWSRRVWGVLTDRRCAYRSDLSHTRQSKEAEAWWELATIARDSISHTQRELRFSQWRKSHPDHMAAAYPPVHFQSRTADPINLALLLPQSGPLASAARAIRNGFLSTHLFHLQTVPEVNVKIYDTEQSDIVKLVDRAIAEGADMIVGPLDKDRVRSVIQGDSLPIPSIALNRISSAPINNATSLQLAIAVEDDVRQIIDKLNDLRVRKVLLVIGSSHWSARASVWLKRSLSTGMQVVDETVLNNLAEVTEDIAEILHVGQSNRRHQALEQEIGKLEFTPRRRHDIDAVVALVDHSEFASLTAALHYHFAGDLPILVAEPTFRNRQLEAEYANGTLYTSIPANLYRTQLTDEILVSFKESELLFPLYVFGSDAYRVAMNIQTLKDGGSLLGLTGVLAIEQPGVLTRRPVWGMVDNQELVPYAPMFKPTVRRKSLM